MKNKCWRVFALLALLCCATGSRAAEVTIPERPNPPKLVNDFAGILTTSKSLEDSLVAFARHTSNQFVIVTVPDLGDYEPWDYSTKLGEKWAVGQRKQDNGVIILIKPKTDQSKGQVFIAPGKGLEGALPDAFCKKIIENEMIPPLRDGNDYDKAVWNALKVMIPVAKGEYDEKKYDEDTDYEDTIDAIFGIIVFFLIFGMIILRSFRGGFGGTSHGSSGTWGGSSFHGFSSHYDNGSSGGSFGGGFGGFGGGSFGGGGAGGSW